jgi:dihydroorotate dehydrogenase electron transfer subunit
MKAKILYNREVSPTYFKMAIAGDKKLKGGDPAQFAMVRGDWGTNPLLRRPFSIYRYRPNDGGVEILYKVIGVGTKLLSEMSPGEDLDIIGPLGNGFPIQSKDRKPIILVAGGIGIAPLMAVAEAVGGKASLIIGGKSKVDVAFVEDDARDIGLDVKYATEDGSMGHPGTAIDILKDRVSKDDIIYACGPEGMLREISRLSDEKGFSGYIATEEKMACGIGACLGCAVKKRGGGYMLTCKDGPVFDIKDIEWEEDK